MDKTGIIHAPGQNVVSPALIANAHALVDSIVKAKPAAAKGKHLKSVTCRRRWVLGSGPDTAHHDVAVRNPDGSHTSTKTGRAARLSGFKGRKRDPGGLPGLNVPQVTDLRRRLKVAKSQLQKW